MSSSFDFRSALAATSSSSSTDPFKVAQNTDSAAQDESARKSASEANNGPILLSRFVHSFSYPLPALNRPRDIFTSRNDDPENPNSDASAATIHLTFHPSEIAASPRNLCSANLWPNDESMQSLLTSVVEIASVSTPNNYITCPMAVALAGSAVKLADYAITSAIKSGTNIITGAVPLSLEALADARQSASKRVRTSATGEWDRATCQLPRSVVQRFWKRAKDRQVPHASMTMPSILAEDAPDYEDNQIACGAMVVAWINMLLAALTDTVKDYGSPILSLGMLESAFDPDYPRTDVHKLFKQLGCTVMPVLDELILDTTEPKVPVFGATATPAVGAFGSSVSVETAASTAPKFNFGSSLAIDSGANTYAFNGFGSGNASFSGFSAAPFGASSTPSAFGSSTDPSSSAAKPPVFSSFGQSDQGSSGGLFGRAAEAVQSPNDTAIGSFSTGKQFTHIFGRKTAAAQVEFDDCMPRAQQDISSGFNQVAKREDESIRRILDGSNSWYHQPDQLRQVAQRFAVGELRSHPSDRILSDDLRMRPVRVEGMLPPNMLSQTTEQCEALSRRKKELYLHFEVTDGKDRHWRFIVILRGQVAYLQFTQPGMGEILAMADLSATTPDSKLWVGANFDMQRSSTGPSFNGPCWRYSSRELSPDSFSMGITKIWREFDLVLSEKQQQIIELIPVKAASSRDALAQLSESYWNDVANNSHQHLNVVDASTGTRSPESSSISTTKEMPLAAEFGSYELFGPSQEVSNIKSSKKVASKRISAELAAKQWRGQMFEQILWQAIPLLDSGRWGMSRYSEFHTDAMRREFQAHLINAAMTANSFPLFPAVILDLIAGYSTIESLPYVTPEMLDGKSS